MNHHASDRHVKAASRRPGARSRHLACPSAGQNRALSACQCAAARLQVPLIAKERHEVAD